jgi:hypothetical protein
MPSVTTVPSTLKYSPTAPACNALPSLPCVLPFSRHGHATLSTALRGLILPLLRLYIPRAQDCAPRGLPEAALSIDLMVRQYPDLYRRITSWSI